MAGELMNVTIGCNYCGEKLPDGEGHVCVPVEAAVTGRGIITLEQAVEFLTRWRDDDHEFPIPITDWGSEFAYAIDLLTGEKNPQGGTL